MFKYMYIACEKFTLDNFPSPVSAKTKIQLFSDISHDHSFVDGSSRLNCVAFTR